MAMSKGTMVGLIIASIGLVLMVIGAVMYAAYMKRTGRKFPVLPANASPSQRANYEQQSAVFHKDTKVAYGTSMLGLAAGGIGLIVAVFAHLGNKSGSSSSVSSAS